MIPTITPRDSLEQLLESLFDAASLRHYLIVGPEGDLLDRDLPNNLSLRDLVTLAAGLLIRRGLVDVAFFDRLVAKFPRRTSAIRIECGRWIAARPSGTECGSIDPDSSQATLLNQLADLYRRRDDLIVAGIDTRPIEEQILTLRSTIKRGPQLHRGESFLAGRYRLVEKLGSGGFATVWRAYDHELRGYVALKVLHPQWGNDSSYCERFVRGARMMLRLRHPNIVRVLREPCDEEGFKFYVMELIDGPCLQRAVLDGAIDLDARIRAILSICDALAFAHKHGYVHRDIKPSNILLDNEGLVFLSDFDLVHGNDTTGGTIEGAGLGSFLYASPESMTDASRSDARADIYSLGMTMLFAILGRHLRMDDRSDLYAGALALPGELVRVVKQAAAGLPEHRYPSALEFKQALKAAQQSMKSDPVSAVVSRLRDLLEAHSEHAHDVLHEHVRFEASSTSLVLTSKPWDTLAVDCVLNILDLRVSDLGPTNQSLMASAGDFLKPLLREIAWSVDLTPTQSTFVTRGGQLPAPRIVHFIIGRDFTANAEACRRLVTEVVGLCIRHSSLIPATIHSVALPIPVRLADQFPGLAYSALALEVAVRAIHDGFADIETIYFKVLDTHERGQVRALTSPPIFADSRVIVDWTDATHSLQGKRSFSCWHYLYAHELLDDIWGAFPADTRPPPFTYSERWGLLYVDTGKPIPYRRNMHQTIEALGLEPGSELKVVLFQ